MENSVENRCSNCCECNEKIKSYMIPNRMEPFTVTFLYNSNLEVEDIYNILRKAPIGSYIIEADSSNKEAIRVFKRYENDYRYQEIHTKATVKALHEAMKIISFLPFDFEEILKCKDKDGT